MIQDFVSYQFSQWYECGLSIKYPGVRKVWPFFFFMGAASQQAFIKLCVSTFCATAFYLYYTWKVQQNIHVYICLYMYLYMYRVKLSLLISLGCFVHILPSEPPYVRTTSVAQLFVLHQTAFMKNLRS